VPAAGVSRGVDQGAACNRYQAVGAAGRLVSERAHRGATQRQQRPARAGTKRPGRGGTCDVAIGPQGAEPQARTHCFAYPITARSSTCKGSTLRTKCAASPAPAIVHGHATCS
jgi:hypothetical protein